MANLKKIKQTGLLAGVIAVSATTFTGALVTFAQESNQSQVTVNGEKPLDNLGEIAEKPKFSKSKEQTKLRLYDKDEKVGESVKLEGLKRDDKLGNTKKEFATFEEAEKWAETKQKEGKISSFSVLPVFWSDQYVHSYTVEATINSEVEING